MTNKEVARLFKELAGLMEFHGENQFKIRSYNSAYINIRQLSDPILELSDDDISKLKGVGKAIGGKLAEIREKGTFNTLERYRSNTPKGIQEMLNVKGLGAKKVKAVHEGLGIESAGELLYACHENRLVDLKGFGQKTQQQLKEQLEYVLQASGHHLYQQADAFANKFEEKLEGLIDGRNYARVGGLRRCLNTIDTLEYVVAGLEQPDPSVLGLSDVERSETMLEARFEDAINVKMTFVDANVYGGRVVELTGPASFLEQLNIPEAASSEEAVFELNQLPFIKPELRDHSRVLEMGKNGNLPELIEVDAIKGVVHSHSTYSDGSNTLEDMAHAAKDRGYEYLVITDHSQAAFYANGLKPERVLTQWAEIDRLNEALEGFTILKGIESDILSDGSLDYEDEMLAGFDVVIASVHSNLRMDEVKATDRLIKAISNPFTHILGHPTGRLLLSRKGYPIDHKAVIDACGQYGVVIEVNANPYRLDLDWRWIDYALGQNVMLSINPDAHSVEQIDYIKYGVLAARKGGLTADLCLNTRNLEDFRQLLYEMKNRG